MRRGKELVLKNLNGVATKDTPFLLFTWEFDYVGKVSGVEPWEIACGGSKWDKVYMGLLDEHEPDVLLFSHSAGAGELDTTLVDETDEKWIFRDNNTGITYEMLKSSLTIAGANYPDDARPSPAPELKTFDDIDKLPDFGGWGQLYLQRLSETIKAAGDRALVMPYHCPSYIAACYTLGFERAMESMLEQPEFFQHLIDKYNMGLDRMMKDWKGAGAEAVFIADSWASCDIISPALFERFALPAQQAVVKAAHDNGLKIILWNAGNLEPILEMEAAAGFDAFGFEQPRKGFNMTVEKVRRVFKDKCILGNIDSEQLLIENDGEKIAKEVKSQIEQSGPYPFIMSTGSPIPHNAPISAVNAMIRASRSN